MKRRSCGNLYKNAVGTVFLLIGAFFVCSTLLSMRAVFADPIAPTINPDTSAAQSGRATSRANPRSNASARPTRQTTTSNAQRGVASRNVASRNNTTTNAAGTRTNQARNVVSRTTAVNRTAQSRGVSTRNVRARNASQSRVSLTGDAIRGSKGTGSTYIYLNKNLYTGNYSNIIDASTGLISADAYSTCLESYYTCMDEICTARNEAQRRCACAGRIKSFAAAEDALAAANEDFIKITGQVALLNTTKGKDVSAAFALTEAEQVMTCVSWKEVTDKYGESSEEAVEWCNSHGIYGSTKCSKPSYCSTGTGGNDFGFNVDDLKGSSSDILATLSSWADTIRENSDVILKEDNKSALDSITKTAEAVSGITGDLIDLNETDVADVLAETWGYDLFGYAHNNVCARVLDSCFNGIYESCGTPPSGGRCANGANSSCPYNYNSKITISSAGEVVLNERSSNSTNASATCFGYASSSGDPYTALRGPVADARRSIMQKYLLDANADCDVYGEKLKTAAQNLDYKRVAAQQALQELRLTFYNEEQSKTLSDAIAAGTNFNQCISDLWDCYELQESTHPGWTDARIKTYCAQIANAPSCYQDMICNPSYAQFKAIIDKPDSGSCTWDASDYTKNTCRNIVTLNEILNGASNTVATPTATGGTGNSAAFREQCLREALGCGSDGKSGCIRSWTKTVAN